MIFSHWKETSISVLPPIFLCSSIVGWPPEKAYLLIFLLTSSGLSFRNMAVCSSEELILSCIPVSGGRNLQWIALAFLYPRLSAMSLCILQYGSWSIAAGIRHLPFSNIAGAACSAG